MKIRHYFSQEIFTFDVYVSTRPNSLPHLTHRRRKSSPRYGQYVDCCRPALPPPLSLSLPPSHNFLTKSRAFTLRARARFRNFRIYPFFVRIERSAKRREREKTSERLWGTYAGWQFRLLNLSLDGLYINARARGSRNDRVHFLPLTISRKQARKRVKEEPPLYFPQWSFI